MDRGARASAPQTPQGIFATIAAAASALLVHPLPILLPAAVDLWLWRGPRLSPEALTAPVAAVLREQPEADVRLAETLLAWGREGDLAVVVGWFVPSLLAGEDRALVAGAATRPTIALDAGPALLAVAALVVLAALGLMAFKTPLARVARGDAPFDRALPREVVRNAGRYLAFLALVAAAMAAAAVALGLLLAGAALAGIDLLPLVGLAASLAVIVGAIALAFVAEAIAYARVGPIAAARLSVAVVGAQPWAVVGLLLVIWLALFTLPQLLAPLLATGAGVVAAVAVYAAVATVLALARVIFFAERAPGERIALRE